MPEAFDQTMVNAMEQMVDTRSCSRHPSLVTDGSGQITVPFAAPFSQKPLVWACADMNDAVSYSWKVQSWATDGNGNFTGCVLSVFKDQALPAVIALLGTLGGYKTTVPAGAGVGFQVKAESVLPTA